ncbi:MAG: beta-Ala-His dipeptidase [Lachnospiraceae bacterium]|nr:beta-Ala-His dipeptidase [Lachnospiraceae bacterium]
MLTIERILEIFEEYAAVPHVSGHTRRARDFICRRAEELGLAYTADDHDNVIIRKSASPGCDKAAVVILQGHLDMVGDTAPGVTFDFLREGIRVIRDGNRLRADGTTLGADNGIAVALMLAILEDRTLQHPALEAVFTSDEEIGLLGASALDTSLLTGRLLINLDSEDEGILTAGCAGGAAMRAVFPCRRVPAAGAVFTVTIDGLRGGHSGQMIGEGRGNAVKLLARLLCLLEDRKTYHLLSVKGGTKDNAIPMTASAVIAVDPGDEDGLRALCLAFEKDIRRELAGRDDLSVRITGNSPHEADDILAGGALSDEDRQRLLAFLTSLPYGVLSREKDPSLIRTSANPGILTTGRTEATIVTSVRSSLESERCAVCDRIRRLAGALGAACTEEGTYPAWQFREDSPLRTAMCRLWREMTGRDMVVDVIHAGLECGIFDSNLPGLDAVSIGPAMSDIHTYRESLDIASTARLAAYLEKLLSCLAEA